MKFGRFIVQIKLISGLMLILQGTGCAQLDQAIAVNSSKSRFDDAVYKGVTTVIAENKDGLEEYRVYYQAPNGFVDVYVAQGIATSAANRHCMMRNMKTVFFRETVSQPPHVLGNFPRAEVVFGCKSF